MNEQPKIFDTDYYATYDNLDYSTMKMLEEFSAGNPEVIKDIFSSFGPEADDLIYKIKTTSELRDFKGLLTAAHAMVGICGSVGALRLRKISMDIEQQIKTGNNEDAITIVQHIFPAYNEFKELITRY